jgi:hypothetical protein
VLDEAKERMKKLSVDLSRPLKQSEKKEEKKNPLRGKSQEIAIGLSPVAS